MQPAIGSAINNNKKPIAKAAQITEAIDIDATLVVELFYNPAPAGFLLSAASAATWP